MHQQECFLDLRKYNQYLSRWRSDYLTSLGCLEIACVKAPRNKLWDIPNTSDTSTIDSLIFQSIASIRGSRFCLWTIEARKVDCKSIDRKQECYTNRGCRVTPWTPSYRQWKEVVSPQICLKSQVGRRPVLPRNGKLEAVRAVLESYGRPRRGSLRLRIRHDISVSTR